MDYARVAKTIGKRGYVQFGTLEIEVEVVNYKQSYGKDRWQVKPVAGKGEAWVEEVKLIK